MMAVCSLRPLPGSFPVHFRRLSGKPGGGPQAVSGRGGLRLAPQYGGRESPGPHRGASATRGERQSQGRGNGETAGTGRNPLINPGNRGEWPSPGFSLPALATQCNHGAVSLPDDFPRQIHHRAVRVDQGGVAGGDGAGEGRQLMFRHRRRHGLGL